MLFNTPLFFLFFIAFLLIYGMVLSRDRSRVYWILISSLIFYAGWNYRFVPLLVGSAVTDYFLAQAIFAATTLRRKKQFVALSIAMNLGILALFKYADFVLVSVSEFLQLFGYAPSSFTLSWVLPVGISFYTFQSLSYTIDVYRGDMQPRKGLAAFVAALSFFPQLVAGPILRARQILPQFHNLQFPTWPQAKHGFLLITVGLVKKTTADLLAIPAAVAFDSSESVSLLETWTGVLAFAGQIYGDFSGYSDMAIGIALLIGFQIPDNFRLPYFATSPIDFWRRWHISLSSWLRDYLYIPLGGNRNSRQRNIFITMLLGGLWHGAAWNFVVWGAFHGLLIMISHYMKEMSSLAFINQSSSRWVSTAKRLLTFYLVILSWVLFRASSLDSAIDIMVDMHSFGVLPAHDVVASITLVLTIIALLMMHVVDSIVIYKSKFLESKSWLFWPIIILGQAACLMIGEPSSEFIYFQF